MLSDEMQYAIAIAQIVSSAAVSLGVIIAAITIVYNVKTARKVHTSVFLGESRFDVDYKKGLSTMRRIHESNKAFRSYMYPSNGQADLTDEEKLEKREIIYCLGFYERMAVRHMTRLWLKRFSIVLSLIITRSPFHLLRL